MSPKSNGVGAIILAAGESSRFGRPKQLVRFQGESLVRRAVDAASNASCSPVIVVTGNAQAEVKNELCATNAALVENQEWKRGVGTSIRAGIQYLIDTAQDINATVLLTCDQPFVDVAVVSGLITLHFETGKPIVASAYEDTLGVPALFNRSAFQELLRLDAESGAKTIIFANRARVAQFSFPRGKIDIDTVEDFESIAQER